MVNGVESFRCVHEQHVEVAALLHRAVEVLVEVADVILEHPQRDEAFLRPIQGVVERRSDRRHHRLRDDAIVRVGDRDRSRMLRS